MVERSSGNGVSFRAVSLRALELLATITITMMLMLRCGCSIYPWSTKDNYYQSQFPQPCSGSDVATAPLNNALNKDKYRSSVIIVVHVMSCHDNSPAPGPDTRPVDINGEESSCNLSGTNALMPVECIPCRRSCMHTYTWLYSEKVLR